MFLKKEKALFKKISIRGRLAFGTKCIEQYIKENNLSNTWLNRLVDTLWEFTFSNDLGDWHDKISNLEPYNILDTSSNNKYTEYDDLSESDFNELRSLYTNLHKDFINLIDYTIEIGVNNLYSGTGSFSESTLEPALKVYRNAIILLKKIPDLEKFSISKFSESNGWGDSINRKRFD